MKITFAKRIGAIVATLALTAAGAGCQQQTTSSSSAPAPGTSGSAAGGGLTSTAWTRAPYSAVKDGGTLTMSVSQLPDNWNYNQADGSLADLNTVRLPMGAGGYIVADEKGTVSLNKDYIESATVKSQDPEVIEVKYNKNAKWEDGSPITIKDMIAYAKAMSGADKKYQIASTQGWEDIESVTQTADEFTGEIKYKKKTVDWIQYTYPDIPASISSDSTKFNKGYVTTPTPSAGPFKVAKVDQTGKVITLTRNPVWWGQKPKLDTIIFKVLTQVQEPQAFANKEIDVLNNIVSGDSYASAKARTDAVMEKTYGVTWTHVTLNTTRGALADVNVRKAIGLAINRQLIGQVVVGPLEAPVTLVNNAVFMPGQAGYEDSYGGALTYDPAKAEQTLKDAGYAKGSDGVYAKDGKALTFSIAVPAEAKSNINRATQISKDLTAIGFKVDLKTVPSDAYFKDYVTPKNFDMVTFSWQGTLFPIATAANLFSPVSSAQNYTGYANPEVATLNAQTQAEFDQAKRIQLADQLSKAMLSDYTIIPFYATPNIVAVNSKLANVGASQFETADWTTVGYTS